MVPLSAQRFVFCRQMKKAVTATTMARGTAVNSRQDDGGPVGVHEGAWIVQVGHIVGLGVLLLLAAGLIKPALISPVAPLGLTAASPATPCPRATPSPTTSTPATLDSEASPGWSEFEPYQGLMTNSRSLLSP